MDKTSLGFQKPKEEEYYDINIFNQNAQLANDLIEKNSSAIGQMVKIETIDFASKLVNGWTVVSQTVFKGAKIGNRMFIEGIIKNSVALSNSIVATNLPIPTDGKYHGGSMTAPNQPSLYLIVQPDGSLQIQSQTNVANAIYAVSINYPC